MLRLQEIHTDLATIEARSAQFAALQRQYFLTMEKYWDHGTGTCVLAEPQIAQVIVAQLADLHDWHVAVPHFTVMPNHCHALIVPSPDCTRSLAEIMKRLKGRTASLIRSHAGGSGPVWQREWFDRWIRSEAEWEKTVAYIRDNPVKAGLARTWEQHLWTK